MPTMSQTRFWGGKDRGPCVQITQVGLEGLPLGVGFLQMSREEAALLATELLRFASGNEVEDLDAEITI